MSTSAGIPGGGGIWPCTGMMPNEGLSVYTPHQAAGIRSDPPRSLPSSRADSPAATAAAAPPEEPPGVRPASQGLLVVPNSSL